MIAKYAQLRKEALKWGFPAHGVYLSEYLCLQEENFNEALFWLLLLERCHSDKGNIRLPLSDEVFNRVVVDWQWPLHEEAQERRTDILDKLLKQYKNLLNIHSSIFKQEKSPYVIHQNCLYSQRQFEKEKSLIALLDQRLNHSPKGLSWLRPIIQNMEETQKSEVWYRLMTSLAIRGITLLSGGPGTGKTTALVSLVKELHSLAERNGKKEPSILLGAPTGRAAKRMEEAFHQQGMTQVQAQTLHRLLGWGYQNNRGFQLQGQLMIVDEASMVDLGLMTELLQKLPLDCPLLLIGDKDQLPSVESGALLGDMLSGYQSEDYPLKGGVVLLNRIYRSKQQIIEEAAKVQRGEMLQGTAQGPLVLKPFPQRISQLWEDLMKEYSIPEDRSFPQHPDQWEQKKEEIQQWFRLYQDLCVLTPLRKGACGVEALNRRIANGLYGNDKEYNHGQPIIILKNDYPLELYNGDRGILFQFGRHFYGVFSKDGSYRIIPVNQLNHWELSYVQTIHKSQGSEFRRVCILLPPGSDTMMYRELLYTAITRAKEEVLILANNEELTHCLQRKIVRSSGLVEYFQGNS